MVPPRPVDFADFLTSGAGIVHGDPLRQSVHLISDNFRGRASARFKADAVPSVSGPPDGTAPSAPWPISPGPVPRPRRRSRSRTPGRASRAAPPMPAVAQPADEKHAPSSLDVTAQLTDPRLSAPLPPNVTGTDNPGDDIVDMVVEDPCFIPAGVPEASLVGTPAEGQLGGSSHIIHTRIGLSWLSQQAALP